MKIYTITIDVYRNADGQPEIFTASCDELPGLALGGSSRAEVMEKTAARLPGLLGRLGRSTEGCRLEFHDMHKEEDAA